MTLAVSTQVDQPPPIGTLIYLASYLLKMGLSAETTPPDTPNMYSAKLEVQGDQGDMNTDPLRGPRGYPGRAQFPLRRQDRPIVNNVGQLPDWLTNTEEDRGKYWEIDTIVDGVVTERWSHVWYGDRWKVIQMGTRGVPGPAPSIDPEVVVIPYQNAPTYPDTTSFVETDGPRLSPSWRFNLALPPGIPGVVGPVATMPDVDLTTSAPAAGDVLAATGTVDDLGRQIWRPLPMRQYATQFYSVPQSAFTAYTGTDQRHLIGSFAIPPQPFPWTPIVWGHIGAGGLSLSARPLMIGCRVLLADAVTGKLVSRGLGNSLGEVNIMPHYSTPDRASTSITATNKRAIVPAHHTGTAGTVYLNLWNEGQLGEYTFAPSNAQLFILVLPMERGIHIEFPEGP